MASLTDDEIAAIKHALLGTCDSVEAVLERMGLDADAAAVEDALLDGTPSVECCQGCHWWFESGDLVGDDPDQAGFCSDCRDEEDATDA